LFFEASGKEIVDNEVDSVRNKERASPKYNLVEFDFEK
jgi:hypothetical protein